MYGSVLWVLGVVLSDLGQVFEQGCLFGFCLKVIISKSGMVRVSSRTCRRQVVLQKPAMRDLGLDFQRAWGSELRDVGQDFLGFALRNSHKAYCIFTGAARNASSSFPCVEVPFWGNASIARPGSSRCIAFERQLRQDSL